MHKMGHMACMMLTTLWQSHWDRIQQAKFDFALKDYRNGTHYFRSPQGRLFIVRAGAGTQGKPVQPLGLPRGGIGPCWWPERVRFREGPWGGGVAILAKCMWSEWQFSYHTNSRHDNSGRSAFLLLLGRSFTRTNKHTGPLPQRSGWKQHPVVESDKEALLFQQAPCLVLFVREESTQSEQCLRQRGSNCWTTTASLAQRMKSHLKSVKTAKLNVTALLPLPTGHLSDCLFPVSTSLTASPWWAPLWLPLPSEHLTASSQWASLWLPLPSEHLSNQQLCTVVCSCHGIYCGHPSSTIALWDIFCH